LIRGPEGLTIVCGEVTHKARTGDPGLMDRMIHWTAQDVVSIDGG
jgi:hypothetical protein